MKYEIITTETLCRSHIIEANTAEEAEAKLYDYEHGAGEVIDCDANVEIDSVKPLSETL